jgi:alkylhydroperoxidase family enzyme
LPRPLAPRSTTVAKPIPLLDASQARGEAQVFIRASDAMLGGPTNATLMWAHIPYIAKLWPPYQLVMEREGLGGVLPTVLKMYVLVRTAHLNRATYSLAHRTALARAAGVPETQLHALTLPDCEHAATFSERERVMLRWVDEVATNMAKRRADLFDALSRHFTDVELVELTGLCAMANQVDLTLNALRVPLESATEIERVNHSPRIEPARVKAYLATIYAHWPETFPTPHR